MRTLESILYFVLAVLTVAAFAPGFTLTPGEFVLVALALIGVVLLVSLPGS